MRGIYIVIPTYNESENIQDMIKIIRSIDCDYHIIVVDDNSPDGTAAVVQEMQKSSAFIHMVKRPGKLGIGSAICDGIKTALSSADCQYIVTLDADFSHNPADIPILLEVAENADMVQGSRYMEGGKITGWTWRRKFISRTANCLYRYLLNIPQHEITTSFRVYSRKCAECITQYVNTDRYEYGLATALVIRDNGFKVKEVPIEFVDRTRGKSKLKVSDIVYSLRYLAYIFILRLSRNLGIQRFIRFCIVGTTGIIINQGLLWVLTDKLGIYYLYSALISIEGSILSNFVFNDLWTFRDKRRISSPVFIRLLKYNLLCAVGSSFNYAILWFFTDILHFYYLLSNLFGIAAALAWNYTISLNWAWVSLGIKKKKSNGK
ncbi:MAG: glycosyltransferase family 2 protein [Chloroflexi bacterium]|nr:glycosyltransferase family 2 protein [Chloroflexota bacterium]